MSFNEFIDEPLNQRSINIGKRKNHELYGTEFVRFDTWSREIEFREYRFIRVATYGIDIFMVLRDKKLIHKLEFNK